MNTQHIPTFEVFRPIEPAGGSSALSEYFIDQAICDPEIDVESQKVEQLFRPAAAPKVTLLGAKELSQFHEDIDLEPSAKQVRELRSFVLSSIAKNADRRVERLHIASLISVRPPKHKAAHSLEGVISGGFVLPERRKAIQAVGEFYDIDPATTTLGGFQEDVRTRLASGKQGWHGRVIRRTVAQNAVRLPYLPKLVALPVLSVYHEPTPVN